MNKTVKSPLALVWIEDRLSAVSAGRLRAGDTLVVTKLDRLARSLPDARDILDELTTRRLLFNVLEMVAEF